MNPLVADQRAAVASEVAAVRPQIGKIDAAARKLITTARRHGWRSDTRRKPAVGAVTVKVQDVVMPRALGQVLAQALKGRRAQDMHVDWQLLFLDQVDHRP